MPFEAPQRQLARTRLADRRRLRREAEARVQMVKAGDAEHELAALQRLGERGVRVGRGAVRLYKQQVYADRRGLRPRYSVHQVRDQGARPRPLAARLERALVDFHDDRRRGEALPRQDLLISVEQRLAPHSDGRQVQHKDERASREDRRAERARRADPQSSISRPS